MTGVDMRIAWRHTHTMTRPDRSVPVMVHPDHAGMAFTQDDWTRWLEAKAHRPWPMPSFEDCGPEGWDVFMADEPMRWECLAVTP